MARKPRVEYAGGAPRALCRHAGLTQREAAVSQQLQRLEARLDAEPTLRCRLADIETNLDRETNC